jgi:hypothetical protein
MTATFINAQFFSLVSLLTLSKRRSLQYTFLNPTIPPGPVDLKLDILPAQKSSHLGLTKIVTLVLAYLNRTLFLRQVFYILSKIPSLIDSGTPSQGMLAGSIIIYQ